MKPQLYAASLALLFFCALAAKPAAAQEVYGYSSVDYDYSTGFITASSTTELDYSVQQYYKARVSSKLLDEYGNVLITRGATDNYQWGYVTITYGIYDTSSDEYEVVGTHNAKAALYDYALGQYWDYFNFLYLQDFTFDWFPSYLFRAPGTPRTTPTDSITVGATHSYAHKNVIRVGQTLKNSGNIVPPPENEDYSNEVAVAGGIDQLGPLPMGQGRVDFQGLAYTSPIMVIGQVSPSSAYSGTFRWTRLIRRRSWYIEFNSATNTWNVSWRSSRGIITPDIDTGNPEFNDPTPSGTGKIYIYDNSALLPSFGNGANLAVGDYIREEKAFTYLVDYWDGSRWVRAGRRNIGQVIIVRRQALTGIVSSDWLGVENSNQTRRLDAVIKSNEVRSMVGGTAPISISASANSQ